MIKNLKTLIAGIIIGLLLGLWFGVNIGKDQPVFSNPFADRSLKQKMLDSGGDLLEKSGRAIKDTVDKP